MAPAEFGCSQHSVDRCVDVPANIVSNRFSIGRDALAKSRRLPAQNPHSGYVTILMIVSLLRYSIMSSRRPTDIPYDTVSRRHLLAVGGVVAVGSLAGCLNRVASVVTNTGSSPAAAFAGAQGESMGEFIVGEPHISRLTPTLAGRVELEGWVTSSPVMAQDYNSSRSNKPSRSADGGSIGENGSDADADFVAYLGGNPMVGERFTVCLPAAEVPGEKWSIREEVTPERLIAYLTGDGSVAGLSKADSKSRGGGDCDDTDPDVYPGAVCGTTPHFVAEVSEPTATGGSLEVVRTENGTVFLSSSDRASAGAVDMQIEMQMTLTADPIIAGPGGDGSDTSCSADDDPCGPGVWARTAESGSSTAVSVYQVMVQPPGCPKPFPALLYVQRCESNDQLVYTGGWVIDDAALYEDSVTVLSMAGLTQVVGIECCFDYSSDVDGDGFGDVVKRSVSGERALRGARIDSGTVEELVKVGVLSAEGFDPEDPVVSDFIRSRSGGGGGGRVALTHVAVDAPVLHLTSASRASQDVKFKAGAELSKAVN